jgi:hypothetical protein
MLFTGRIWRDGTFWLAEANLADVMTQGRTRHIAIEMLADAIESLVNRRGFAVAVTDLGGDDVLIEANDGPALVALALKRQREKHGRSLADVARALGRSSRNSYARYEAGTSIPSIAKLSELFRAVAPETPIVLGVHARTRPGRRVDERGKGAGQVRRGAR